MEGSGAIVPAADLVHTRSLSTNCTAASGMFNSWQHSCVMERNVPCATCNQQGRLPNAVTYGTTAEQIRE